MLLANLDVIEIEKEVNYLPNIKSAKKRVSVIASKSEKNRMTKSRLKTAIKAADVLIAEGDKKAAILAFGSAQKMIDQASAKGLLHRNAAARRKSRLAKAIK